jgi:glycosyl transferase family 25
MVTVDLNSLPIWVINLENRQDRWKSMINTLKTSKLPLENMFRFNAVNSATMSPGDIKTIVSPQAFSQLFSKKTYRTEHSQLTLGAIGCYLSHVSLWKKLVESNFSHFLIFEDDTKLDPMFFEKLNYIIGPNGTLTNHSFDLLFLGSIVSPTSEILEDPVIKQHKFVNIHSVYGTHGYIISKDGAKKLLQNAFPIEKQVDTFISEHSNLTMFLVVPNIAYQSGFYTDIQNSCYNCGPLVQVFEVNGKRIPIQFTDSFKPILKWGIILSIAVLILYTLPSYRRSR